jgi:hypothetical protein
VVQYGQARVNALTQRTYANVKLLAEKAPSSAALPIFTSSGTVSFTFDLARHVSVLPQLFEGRPMSKSIHAHID